MIPTSRSKALADTLDHLEALSQSETVRVRVRVHDGATIEGSIVSVSRRQLEVSTNPYTPTKQLFTSDIATIRVASSGQWDLWFDYGNG